MNVKAFFFADYQRRRESINNWNGNEKRDIQKGNDRSTFCDIRYLDIEGPQSGLCQSPAPGWTSHKSVVQSQDLNVLIDENCLCP